MHRALSKTAAGRRTIFIFVFLVAKFINVKFIRVCPMNQIYILAHVHQITKYVHQAYPIDENIVNKIKFTLLSSRTGGTDPSSYVALFPVVVAEVHSLFIRILFIRITRLKFAKF